MRLLAVVALMAALFAPIPPASAQSDLRDIQARVEAEFIRAMTRLSYNESSALYRSATAISRSTWTEQQFAQMLDHRKSGLAGPGAYTITEVRLLSEQQAVVRARVQIRITLGALANREDLMTFTFCYEDGDWRPDLNPFISLVSQ